MRTPAFRDRLKPILIALAVFHGAVFYTMAKSGLDTSIGANSAFLLNFALSMLYVFVLFQQRELGNLNRVSWLIAWLKMFGTGTNTVFMNIHPAYAGQPLPAPAQHRHDDGGLRLHLSRVEDAARSQDSGQLGQDRFGVRQVGARRSVRELRA